MNVKAILTDIEGTTSAISFVHDVLFPYAREALPGFVSEYEADTVVAELLTDARAEAGEPDASTERIIDVLVDWIDQDRKATPLKSLQGLVWRKGYENGDFTGHVYADAVQGLRRWHEAGIRLYVYSSGSVGAQKLLFGNSDAGDLTPLFSGYFDTTTGHKKEAPSYAAIADEIAIDARDILFLSDVAEELDAASEAGMQTCQLVRDDAVVVGTHRIARDFDDVIIEPPD